MDGVSGAVALVSLAVQLVTTVQQITKFFRNIQNAPKKVFRLVEVLEQFQGNLDHVKLLVEYQVANPGLPGSPRVFIEALQCCEPKVRRLEELIEAVSPSSHSQCMLRKLKSWE